MIYGNPASQVLAEANAFTIGEIAMDENQEFNLENYLRGVARNSFIMTGLKLPNIKK